MILKRQRQREKFYKIILNGLQSKSQKEKSAALNDLNIWMKNDEFEEELEGADWEKLISGFITTLTLTLF